MKTDPLSEPPRLKVPLEKVMPAAGLVHAVEAQGRREGEN
jgi:hypothetical protein